jgi:hypothetical protein
MLHLRDPEPDPPTATDDDDEAERIPEPAARRIRPELDHTNGCTNFIESDMISNRRLNPYTVPVRLAGSLLLHGIFDVC